MKEALTPPRRKGTSWWKYPESGARAECLKKVEAVSGEELDEMSLGLFVYGGKNLRESNL